MSDSNGMKAHSIKLAQSVHAVSGLADTRPLATLACGFRPLDLDSRRQKAKLCYRTSISSMEMMPKIRNVALLHPITSSTKVPSVGTPRMYQGTQLDGLSAGDTIRVRACERCLPVTCMPVRCKPVRCKPVKCKHVRYKPVRCQPVK